MCINAHTYIIKGVLRRNSTKSKSIQPINVQYLVMSLGILCILPLCRNNFFPLAQNLTINQMSWQRFSQPIVITSHYKWIPIHI